MQSRSAAFMPALASACRVARRASVAPVSPSDTQCRVLIPERWVIHSSEVSMMCERSSSDDPVGNVEPGGDKLGVWHPCSLRERGAGRRFARDSGLGKGAMDLTVTRAQYDAVRGT